MCAASQARCGQLTHTAPIPRQPDSDPRWPAATRPSGLVAPRPDSSAVGDVSCRRTNLKPRFTSTFTALGDCTPRLSIHGAGVSTGRLRWPAASGRRCHPESQDRTSRYMHSAGHPVQPGRSARAATFHVKRTRQRRPAASNRRTTPDSLSPLNIPSRIIAIRMSRERTDVPSTPEASRCATCSLSAHGGSRETRPRVEDTNRPASRPAPRRPSAPAPGTCGLGPDHAQDQSSAPVLLRGAEATTKPPHLPNPTQAASFPRSGRTFHVKHDRPALTARSTEPAALRSRQCSPFRCSRQSLGLPILPVILYSRLFPQPPSGGWSAPSASYRAPAIYIPTAGVSRETPRRSLNWPATATDNTPTGGLAITSPARIAPPDQPVTSCIAATHRRKDTTSVVKTEDNPFPIRAQDAF
jgi:hypothetical protein